MRDRTLIRAGTIGAIVAAICCVTPVLAILLSVIGLSAWIAMADSIAIPQLFAFLGLLALGVFRRHARIRTSDKPQTETEP